MGLFVLAEIPSPGVGCLKRLEKNACPLSLGAGMVPIHFRW